MKLHLNEAREATINYLRSILNESSDIEKILFIEDIFSRFSLIVWTSQPSVPEIINLNLVDKAGPYWSGDCQTTYDAISVDLVFFEDSWNDAKTDETNPSLRIMERHRSRRGWFEPRTAPIWILDSTRQSETSPIITFYSFNRRNWTNHWYCSICNRSSIFRRTRCNTRL